MNSLKNPFIVFSIIQIVPLVIWGIIPTEIFIIALQGYQKATLGGTSLLCITLLLLSFFGGYKIGVSIKLKTYFENNIKLIQFLHYISLLLMVLSVFIIFIIIIKNLNITYILEILLASRSNEFKNIIYSSNNLYQIFIMPRHLILTVIITWFILVKNKYKPKSLIIIIISSFILFIFTSSRLTIISLILITFLFLKLEYRLRDNFLLILTFFIVVFIFGLGVFIRSKGTWSYLTGSENIFILFMYEFIAYLISPINYSIALIEYGVLFNISSLLNYTFPFLFSTFNIELDHSFLLQISKFYNPSLNQIGLLGQWFSGFGPLFFIPTIIFGFLSGYLYKSFNKGKLCGLLYYPLVFISIFDSFRGFLLLQNIIAANIIWIIFIIMFYKILKLK